MLEETAHLDIAFFDVDSCDVVWHGNYVKYLEIARCKLLDRIGYNYRDMRESGYFFPIVDLHIKYVKPLLFQQKISVTATLKEWEYRLKISYLIRDTQTQVKLTKATTIQAAVDMSKQELMLECPAILVQKVQQAL